MKVRLCRRMNNCNLVAAYDAGLDSQQQGWTGARHGIGQHLDRRDLAIANAALMYTTHVQ